MTIQSNLNFPGSKKIIILLCLLSGTPIYANNSLAEAQWGCSLQSGVSLGSISRPEKTDPSGDNSDTKHTTILIGGVPLIFVANTDYNQKFGVLIGGSLLFDFPNSQISQQAFRAGILWHLMGGAKELIRGDAHDDYQLISRTSQQLSVAIHGVYVRYSAADKELNAQITGSSFETRLGLRYRFNINWVNAGGVELMSTVLSLPADEQRTESKTVELTLFWQV